MQEDKAFIFYDWRDVGVGKVQYSQSEHVKSKLHGKIIHFKTKSEKEFCLFGSANVTPEGLGLAGKNANAEVSLLIQSEEGGLLNLLGIELKSSNSKKLIEFTATTTKSIYETVRKNNQFKIQLLSAELIYDEIILYSNGHYTEPFNVIFFDSQNRFLHFQKLSRYEHELKIKLHPQFGSFQYVQLASCEDDLISNKLLISDYFLLAKTHPNPKFEKFERICSEIQNGELSKVLDLLHYAIIDETENEEGISMLFTRNNNTNRSKENNEIEKFYDLSTYKPIEYSTIEKNLLLFSPSLRVLDVLKFINSKTLLMNTQEDMRVDEQEEDLDNINGNEENEVKVFCNFSSSCAQIGKKEVDKFLQQTLR